MSSTDLLSLEGINRYLTNKKICTEVYKSVGSTNTLIKHRAANGAPEGLLIVAENQTEGRGRLGRSFYSPDSTGIYMSLLLRPDIPPEKAVLITPAAAVAVCRAIEKLTDCAPEIKWVNDIFIKGKKVCGILTEASFSAHGNKTEYVVLGIGINVYAPQGGFPDEIKDTAGFISEKPLSDLKNRLTAEIINSFYDTWKTDFINEYKTRCFVLGKEISVTSSGKIRTATALDTDNMCRLRVRYQNGKEEYLSSGEISIRI